MYGIKKKIKADVTGSSLIGVGIERPCSWGNYFWCDDVRILNFWAENLETLVDQNVLSDGLVEVLMYTHPEHGHQYGIITDDRISQDWFYNKLCFTGSRGVYWVHAKEMYDYIGDPDNEFEQFTDPISYYKKRGGEYNPTTHVVRYKVGL